MGHFLWVVEIVGARGAGQDRAAVVPVGDNVVIALADGAGGSRNGAVAADAVVDAAVQAGSSPQSWASFLATIDGDGTRLGHGEATAVVLSVSRTAIIGASVGDSGAWVIRGSQIDDLTEGQVRKPLVGGGCAPFAIQATPLNGGTLVVASDGLFRYAKPSDIARASLVADLAAAARELIGLVRLPSGALQDDVSVVLCREALRP